MQSLSYLNGVQEDPPDQMGLSPSIKECKIQSMGAGRGRQRRAQAIFSGKDSHQLRQDPPQYKLRSELREVSHKVIIAAGMFGVSLALLSGGNINEDHTPTIRAVPKISVAQKTTPSRLLSPLSPVASSTSLRRSLIPLASRSAPKVESQFLSFNPSDNTSASVTSAQPKLSTRAKVARITRKPKHHHSPQRKASSPYTYKLEIDGEDKYGNVAPVNCIGNSSVISGTILHPYTSNTDHFFRTATYKEPFNVRTNASTKLSFTGPYAHEAESKGVCAVNETFGFSGYAELNVFTWRLARPAKNLHELVNDPANEAVIRTGGN